MIPTICHSGKGKTTETVKRSVVATDAQQMFLEGTHGGCGD